VDTKSPDIRWKQRFQSFQLAFGQLRSAVKIASARDLSDLEKQGLIQAFEFNRELAWKTLQDFLEDRGDNGIFGSKDATRRAFSAGLIRDGEIWMEMIQSRNRSTHTYNEKIANEIADLIVNDYFGAFEKFEQRFLHLESESP
jgi:nucleotidyltransferase substrate binding protein (TIGR01987 family)